MVFSTVLVLPFLDLEIMTRVCWPGGKSRVVSNSPSSEREMGFWLMVRVASGSVEPRTVT